MERIARRLAVAALAAALLGGCSSVGTRTLPTDRFDFTEAVARSWREQILLNVVRTRYGEIPTFVEVNQIVTGYEFRNEVRVSGEFNLYNPSDAFGAGATSSWSDRPTLTYSPLTGQKFTRVILVPIPTVAVLYLVQSGYRADILLNLFVHSINGNENPGGISASTGGGTNFPRIVELLRSLQKAGGIDFRVDPGGDQDKPMTLLVLRARELPGAAKEAEELRGLLGIPADRMEVPLVTGLLPSTSGGVSVFCYSLLQVLLAMGAGVEVPASHGERGWAFPVRPQTAESGEFRLRVRSGSSAPGDAFVSVKYLDHWFWIDQEDLVSKRTLAVIGLVFRALETGEGGAAPILSIATN